MQVDTESEYLEFVELPNEGRKTLWFQVISKNHQYPLGEIKWFNKWRQYCFYPAPETVFDRTCLADIQKFILEIIRKTR